MKTKYLPTCKSSDPFIRIRVPKNLYDDLTAYAKSNARALQAEIFVRLARTLEENDDLMSRDRLMRLIYSKKLAYKGKVRG